MTLLLVSLAHAANPSCAAIAAVPASAECIYPLGDCIYVHDAFGPPCVDWDVDRGTLIVLPGAEVDVTLSQDTVIETVQVGMPVGDLPSILQSLLYGIPSFGGGASRLTLDAAGNDLLIQPPLPIVHPVRVVNSELLLKGARVRSHPEAELSCVSAEDGDLDILGGSIQGCYAPEGGAIRALDGTVVVQDTQFTDNYAVFDGGDVWASGDLTLLYTDHQTFGSISGDGGSIYFAGNDLTVDDGSFAYGGAFAGWGGTLFVSEDAYGTVHLVHTDIVSMEADVGGAIAVESGTDATLVVQDSTIDTVEAYTEGGAVYLGEGIPEASIEHTTITAGQAQSGGSIAARGDLDLANSTIDNSQGFLDGGAIFASSSAKLTIRNTGFTNTWSEDRGGALFLESLSDLYIEGSWFCDNTASQGGAVWMGDSENDVLVRHSVFHRSDADVAPLWWQDEGVGVRLEHIAVHGFEGDPIRDPGPADVELVDSVIAGSSWSGLPSVGGNAVFEDTEPVLYQGAPFPCGAPFQLHPIDEPAHDGPQLAYEADGIWSLEGNYGPFGLAFGVGLDTSAGLLDPPTTTPLASSDDERLPPADWYADNDGDGFPAMLDCDDADASIHPAANERCFDGLDNDCDGLLETEDDNLERYFLDEDQDRSLEENADQIAGCNGDENTVTAESDVLPGDDCAPDDPSRYEGAEEICDGVDNDCDGLVDGLDDDALGEPTGWYRDDDGDGWASYGDAVPWCGSDAEALDAGLVPGDQLGDCDTEDGDVHPGAGEVCDDGIDNNCNSDIDEDGGQQWLSDPDGDQHVANEDAVQSGCIPDGEPYVLAEDLLGFDCDEDRIDVNASADEVCGDDVDNDCNPATDDLAEAERYFPDGDGDSYGLLGSEGEWLCPGDADGRRLSDTNDDCDDTTGDVNPDATEIPDNGVDEDCSGTDVQSYIAGGCRTAPAPTGLASLLGRRR